MERHLPAVNRVLAPAGIFNGAVNRNGGDLLKTDLRNLRFNPAADRF